MNELYDYEFTGEVKIKESDDVKEIPTMVIDEEDECVDKKTQEKTKNFLNHYLHMKLLTKRI